MTGTAPLARTRRTGAPRTRTRWLPLCAVGLALSAPACVRTDHAVAAEPATAIARVAIPLEGAYLRGPKDARVTIVEFSDFQCPYCAQATTLVDQVLRAYPRDVNLAYKNFPLPMHANAEPAARAALAAGRQGKFWDMHDQLFRHSSDLSSQTIHTLAERIGLDLSRFESDLTSPGVRQQVDLEVRQGKVAGVRGTPTFFINGRLAQNRSFDAFKALIEEELKKTSG